jgi:hypothetical protein
MCRIPIFEGANKLNLCFKAIALSKTYGIMNQKVQKSAKALITQTRAVHMYASLWHASQCVLERGTEKEKDASSQFLSSIVLTAFAFEAYMNHVGKTLPICWQCFERLPTRDKLLKISELLGVEFKRGERPFKTLQTLKNFRDVMAHGKTDDIKEESVAPIELAEDLISQGLFKEWEQQITTQEFAKLVRADVEEILTKIHAARPDPKENLFSFGLGFHTIEVVGENDGRLKKSGHGGGGKRQKK